MFLTLHTSRKVKYSNKQMINILSRGPKINSDFVLVSTTLGTNYLTFS